MSTSVSQAMHAGVNWVAPDTSLPEVARLMKDQDIGAVPVGENDRLVGMVTDRDIVIRGLASGRDLSSLAARDVMTKPIVYCHTTESVDDAVRIMETKQIRRPPVINESKRMVGMLSIGDVAHSGHGELTAEVMGVVSGHHA